MANLSLRACPTWLPSLGPSLAQLQYVKIGIADPAINWIDLGASRRSAKTAIGFTGYPVRCGLHAATCSWLGRLARGEPAPIDLVLLVVQRSAGTLPSMGLKFRHQSSPCSPCPCSIYIRCKNSVQEALYSQMMAIYFKAREAGRQPVSIACFKALREEAAPRLASSLLPAFLAASRLLPILTQLISRTCVASFVCRRRTS